MTDHRDILEMLEFLQLQHELPRRVEKIIDEGCSEITRLRAEAEALREALESIASMAYDSWSNGAIAGEIARYALDATKGTT